MGDFRLERTARRFWELRGRGGRATTAVGALDHGVTRVIAEDSARDDPLSMTRTPNGAARTSAPLVLRCLRLPRRDGGPLTPRGGVGDRHDLPPPALTVSHARS